MGLAGCPYAPSLHVALHLHGPPLPPSPACSGIGVLMNYVLPAYIISVLLVLLMSLLVTQSLGKVGRGGHEGSGSEGRGCCCSRHA